MSKEGEDRLTIWKFLNSSFGLWLLSAVFITGIGSLYTQQKAAEEEKRKREEIVEKLDLEISFRYSQVLKRLWELSTKDQSNLQLAPNATAEDVRKAVVTLTERQANELDPMYPEFGNYGLVTLYAELSRHLVGQQRTQVETSLARLTGGAFGEVDLSNLKAVASRVQSLILPRWKGSWFYYVDCSLETPIC